MKRNNICIDFELLIILISGCFLSMEICFCLTCVFIAINVLKNNGKIMINKAYELVIIMILGILMNIYSHNNVSSHEIIRFMFYIFSPLIYLNFGGIIARKSNIKKIYSTIFVGSIVNLLQVLFKVFTTILKYGFVFDNLRNAKSKMTYLIIFNILIFILKNKDDIFISKEIDRLVFLLCIVVLLFTFSRAYLLYLIAGLIIYCICTLSLKNITKGVGVISIVLCSMFVLVNVNSTVKNLLTNYIEKINYSVTEVSSDTQKWDFYEVNNSWRGYEIYCAKNQFKNSDIIQKIFGSGSKGTYVGKYGYLVSSNIKNGYLPILHNGYYSITICTGIIGLSLYITFFVRRIVKAIIYYRKSKEKAILFYLMIIVGCMCTTYIITGIISATNMALYNCIIMGSFEMYINKIGKNENDKVLL